MDKDKNKYRKYDDPKVILEYDWKILRKYKDELIDKFCQKILEDVEKLIKENKERPYKTYLELFSLIHDRDKHIANMFDGLKRSNAVYKIFCMRAYDLIDDEFMSQFTEETQEKVESLMKMHGYRDNLT